MGLFFGAIKESFKNPPQPRPTDKVVLNPPKSDVMSKAMSSMGRQAFMLAAVAAVYSAGEVRPFVSPFFGACNRERGAGVSGMHDNRFGCCLPVCSGTPTGGIDALFLFALRPHVSLASPISVGSANARAVWWWSELLL